MRARLDVVMAALAPRAGAMAGVLAAGRGRPACHGLGMVASAGRRKHGGFGLAELLAVLAISAILLMVALPSLGSQLRAYRLRLAAADFLGAVELARGQAMGLGQTTMLVPSEASLDWAGGWTVFIDRNGDRRPDAGDDILLRHPPLAPGIAIYLAFASQQGPPYLAYNSMGRGCSHNNSMAARFGTVTLAQGRQLRRIKINMLGRARLCDPDREGAGNGAACAGADP